MDIFYFICHNYISVGIGQPQLMRLSIERKYPSAFFESSNPDISYHVMWGHLPSYLLLVIFRAFSGTDLIFVF